jgi:hypothetical protein
LDNGNILKISPKLPSNFNIFCIVTLTQIDMSTRDGNILD